MDVSLLSLLISEIRARGPLTVAEYMDRALYHPQFGYYARAERRSGRDGDFYTSVDVGPLFGEILAAQLEEMWRVLRDDGAERFDLVEVGAGSGRLACDVLDAAARDHRHFYNHIVLTLVERSGVARAEQPTTLERHAARLADTRSDLPAEISGAIYANELLDAFPVHVVTRTREGLREIVIDEQQGRLVESIAPISDPAILQHLEDSDGVIETGARAEVGLAAASWVGDAAAALRRGFLLLFDYGHEARELYSAVHRDGTLTAYRSHRAEPREWLTAPGASDLTAHVDLTAVRRAAARAGMQTLGMVDQTYFLLSLGLAERLPAGHDRTAIRQRLAARTLMMPGGLGSTMKAMVFAKGVGRPALSGTSAGRLT
jgi:SAM-dependent MidA family methyltransferase